MILVTGGTGLLGSHLLLELVREHEEVVALKRPSSDLEEVKQYLPVTPRRLRSFSSSSTGWMWTWKMPMEVEGS